MKGGENLENRDTSFLVSDLVLVSRCRDRDIWMASRVGKIGRAYCGKSARVPVDWKDSRLGSYFMALAAPKDQR